MLPLMYGSCWKRHILYIVCIITLRRKIQHLLTVYSIGLLSLALPLTIDNVRWGTVCSFFLFSHFLSLLVSSFELLVRYLAHVLSLVAPWIWSSSLSTAWTSERTTMIKRTIATLPKEKAKTTLKVLLLISLCQCGVREHDLQANKPAVC